MKNCYNCGQPVSRKSKTLFSDDLTVTLKNIPEHIPAECLFDGFSDEFKINRITVPVCRKCNSDYAKIDAVIRDYIGITNEDTQELNAITDTTVRAYALKKGGMDALLMEIMQKGGPTFL